MDFSFDSIAIVPELICLFIIPEYYSGILASNLRCRRSTVSRLACPDSLIPRL